MIQVVQALQALLSVWKTGVIVHGPLLGHARVSGHDFTTWKSGTFEVVMPIMPGSSTPYNYETHVLDGLQVVESLCQRYQTWEPDVGLPGVSGLPIQVPGGSLVQRNLAVLHRFISKQDIQQVESVSEVTLTCTYLGSLLAMTIIVFDAQIAFYVSIVPEGWLEAFAVTSCATTCSRSLTTHTTSRPAGRSLCVSPPTPAPPRVFSEMPHFHHGSSSRGGPRNP